MLSRIWNGSRMLACILLVRLILGIVPRTISGLMLVEAIAAWNRSAPNE